jgi:hypothetical protein
VPLEVLLCGRVLLTTQEIVQKGYLSLSLKEGRNCVIVREGDLNPDGLATAIMMAQGVVLHETTPTDDQWPDSTAFGIKMRVRAKECVDKLAASL